MATAARLATPHIGYTLAVGAIAGLANLALYAVGRALFALPFLVPLGGPGIPARPLPVFAIVVACLIPGIGAALVYWGLCRATGHARTLFTMVAIIATLLSLAGPLRLPIDLGTRLALAAMHLVAAVIITPGLSRATGSR